MNLSFPMIKLFHSMSLMTTLILLMISASLTHHLHTFPHTTTTSPAPPTDLIDPSHPATPIVALLEDQKG